MTESGSVEVLAEHEGVRLLRDDASDPARRFEVRYRDDRGAPRRSVHTHDRMFDAIDEFHACEVRTADAPIAEVVELGLKLTAAMSDRDIAAMEPLLGDEYTFVDHRSIGYPELTKQGLLDATVANRDSAARLLFRTHHVASTRGTVSTGGAWTEILGHWHEFEVGVWVFTVADGKGQRTELFPVERLDDALLTFQSLTGTSPS